METILKNINVTKLLAKLIDQTFAEYLKDGFLIIASHQTSIIYLSIKLDTFPSKCKIAKIKP